MTDAPSAPQSGKAHKRSYSIPCASAFRDRVLALAERRGVNAGDLARSVILVLPEATIAAAPDPGDPGREDRETVTLKSGPGEGKPWRRKPRLQVRLPAGHQVTHLRKALGLALTLDSGTVRLDLEDAAAPTRAEAETKSSEEVARLRATVEALAGDPLSHAVRTLDEALFIFGFPPGSRPSVEAIKGRYRQLATIHHPDSDTGNTDRMASLNQAMSFMRGNRLNR